MYALWGLGSGNLTEELPTLAAALAAVCADVDRLGGQGADLVNLASRSAPPHPSTCAS